MTLRLGVLSLLLAVAGCGRLGDRVDPSAALKLRGIAISPGRASVDVGGVIVLRAQGDFEGQIFPADATWTVDDPAIASLNSSGPVASLTLTGVAYGSTSVTATCEGLSAEIDVEVSAQIPEHPGDVYGFYFAGGDWKGISRYPENGALPEDVTGAEATDGFLLSPAGDALYVTWHIPGDPGAQAIERYDLESGTWTLTAVLPNYGAAYFGLDYDAQGRLYTISGEGHVVRVTPATHQVEVLGTTGGMTSLAVGPDGGVYTMPLYSTNGMMFLYRFDPVTGQEAPWAIAQIPGSPFFVNSGGVVIDPDGVAFMADYAGSGIYRCEDSNHNGSAMDAGEVTRFGILPTGYGEVPNSPQICGVAVTRGRGSILVNSGASATGASAGIYWMADRNEDGDADDPGEVTLLNAVPVFNERQGNCIQARRR